MNKADFKAAQEVLGEEAAYEQVMKEAEAKAKKNAEQEYWDHWRRTGLSLAWWGLALYATLLSLGVLSVFVHDQNAVRIMHLAQDRERSARGIAVQEAREQLKSERAQLAKDQHEFEKKTIGWKGWFLTHHFNPEDLPDDYNPTTNP